MIELPDDFDRVARQVSEALESVRRAMLPLGGSFARVAEQTRPLADLHDQLVDRLRPMVNVHAQLAEQLRPVCEVHERLVDQLRPMMEFHDRLIEQCRPLTEQLAQSFEPWVRQMADIQASLGPHLGQIERAFRELPARQQRALTTFALNGWYLDSELSLPDLWDIEGLFDAGDCESAHTRLCEHFDARLDKIEGDLVAQFPGRARLLKAAFKAHRQGDYALSVPPFLSQADGICDDILGEQLYARHQNGKPKIADRMSLDTASLIRAALLYPLTQPMPISANRLERAGKIDLLNRHAVLHGEALDYDTKINSCRALSLLVYVSWALKKAESHARN